MNHANYIGNQKCKRENYDKIVKKKKNPLFSPIICVAGIIRLGTRFQTEE